MDSGGNGGCAALLPMEWDPLPVCGYQHSQSHSSPSPRFCLFVFAGDIRWLVACVVIPSVSKWLGRGGHGPHSSNMSDVPAVVGPRAMAGVGLGHKPLPDRRDASTGTWQVPPGWHIQRSGGARGWTASAALHGVRAQSRVLRAGDLCAERGMTSQDETSECKTKARKGQSGHREKFWPVGPLDVRAKKLACDPGSHPCF